MAVITIRIPEELKEMLKNHPEVNWSRFIREALAKKLELEERKRAAKSIEEIKKRVKPVKKGELDEWVREDRRR